MPLPTRDPDNLDSFEEAVNDVLKDVEEPMRSAALDALAEDLETAAWTDHARPVAKRLAARARSKIDPKVDLLEGCGRIIELGAGRILAGGLCFRDPTSA